MSDRSAFTPTELGEATLRNNRGRLLEALGVADETEISGLVRLKNAAEQLICTLDDDGITALNAHIDTQPDTQPDTTAQFRLYARLVSDFATEIPEPSAATLTAARLLDTAVRNSDRGEAAAPSLIGSCAIV